MRHLPLDPGIFVENRKRFIAGMEANAIAIFNSNDELPSNGDATHRFKQNSDLYWLTGIQQEDTMLILFPDNPDPIYREVLVILRPNELKEKWDGKRLRAQEAKAISGAQNVIWLDVLDASLQIWIHLADIIYLNSNENDRKANSVPVRDYRYAVQMREQYPLHQYRRSAKLLRNLRSVKTAAEVMVLQQAIDITKNAFNKVMALVKPGIMEYEIEAAIYQQFISQRSAGPAYNSIIASGDRARTLHYIENNQECRNGELILMDFGAEYGGYNADLTRTIPVNGKFSPRQKEVYNACLHIHNFAKAMLKPGITLADYTDKVGEQATAEFLKIGILNESDVKNEDRGNRAYRKFLYHGISHHLGLDVHDLGTRTGPLVEGMVLTVEPGIYIEAEQIGIRIENNVWLTATGNEDLMKNIPITVDEIESLMKKN